MLKAYTGLNKNFILEKEWDSDEIGRNRLISYKIENNEKMKSMTYAKL